MKSTNRLLLAACLGMSIVSLAACKKEEATAQPAEAAAMTAPTGTDDAAWKKYLSDVVPRNMGTIANAPIMYYLPAETDADFQGKYDRLAEQVGNAVQRGVTSGNMVAFGSPASAKMGDLIVASFAKAAPGSFKGARVLFVGAAADNDRIKAAIEPTNADYVFVEAK
ncbi:hypothetical protein SAMN05428989_0858 [Pseudoxanthomonas sp. GM95]|uniref:hypothetical protein n=1 Tax=Pseudoxanthomonas sp. GM95 TaxID=1881043 RepID=UPI0008C74C11|nr:hypothetical protein [Pseudoxanthomonas sp. GM95]SEK81656.1 hypothetical protein SAMN05428989_0858 [Pseudoxanthomonas sp. GM95]